MYGVVIPGTEVAGTKRDRSEILPVFKYLKEPENYFREYQEKFILCWRVKY